MKDLKALFGVRYFEAGDVAVYTSPNEEHYHYDVFIGSHEVKVHGGDSLYLLSSDANGGPVADDHAPTWANLIVGPALVKSTRLAIRMRGWKPEEASSRLATKCPVLPYVNGCSTSQVFPPPRLGDPTLQRLLIPAFSAEQAHHIHSTVRVVYVLRGKGVSIVGMEGGTVETELLPGMVCILSPMCPHHFETPQGEPIEVIPFHAFSSVQGESNHAMFRGTFLTNQGE